MNFPPDYTIDHHISGYHPARELNQEEVLLRQVEGQIRVSIQQGFEQMQILVYGDGLAEDDAEEAALEYLEGIYDGDAVAAIKRLK